MEKGIFNLWKSAPSADKKNSLISPCGLTPFAKSKGSRIKDDFTTERTDYTEEDGDGTTNDTKCTKGEWAR